MKTIIRNAKRILFFTGILLSATVFNSRTNAQCNSSTQNASITADNTGATQTWSENANSHETITGVTNGATYKVSSSTGTDFFTIKTGSAASGGTVITSGVSPVTFTSTATTIYIVVRTNSGCSTSSTIRTISLAAKPTITSITSSACVGSTFTVTGTSLSGVTSITINGTNAPTFSIVSSASITVTVPLGATTGTVSVTGPGGTTTSGSSITINPAPVDNSGIDKSFCSGSNTTIGAASTAGHTYSWSPSTGLSSSTNANPTATPNATTTYTLTETITATGCAVSNSVVVTVNPVPGDNAGADKVVCSGSGTTIGASSTAGRTYSWSPTTGLSSATTSNPTATPTTTTTYTLTETISATSCNSVNTVVVTVNPLPTNITPTGTATICSGNSSNISIAGSQSGVSYQLRNNSGNISVGSPVSGSGGTISLPTGSLASSTTFNVLATNSTTSCSQQMTGTVTVTVNPVPVDNAGVDKSVCIGGSTTIGAASTAGRTYSWSPSTGLSSSTISNPTVTPTVTTTYSLTETITATSCSSTNTVVVTVNPIPTAAITANYCTGTSFVQLSATSNTSYLWSTGETTQTVSKDLAGSYTVTVTNSGGCTASGTYNLAFELVTNGNFSSGNTGFTTSYTYQADIAGNTELNPEGLYGVGANANNYHSAFYGTDHTSGSGNFMVINGSTSATPVTVWQQTITLNTNTTYYFSAYAMSMNAVSPYAQLKFAVNGVQVGTTATLAAGASSNAGPFNWVRFYGTWNSGASTTAVLSIVDLLTVAGGNDFGLDDISCSTLSPVALSVTPSAATVCAGDNLIVLSNETGGGYPLTYTWSGPSSYSASSQDLSRSSSTTAMSGSYAVTVTDNYGCTVTGSVSASVGAYPTDKTPTAASSTICTGTSTNIQIATSQSGVNYQLRNDATNAAIGSAVAGTGGTINLSTGTLTSTTTFNVLATNATTSCSVEMLNMVTVTVNAKSTNPTSATASATTICAGSSTTLTLNGGGGGTGTTIKWYTTSCGGTLAGTGNGLSVSPASTTTYYGRYEDGAPCNFNTSCSSVTITVKAAPANKTVTAVSSTICSGSSTNIQVAATVIGVTYQLRDNATNANVGLAGAGTGGTINLSTGSLSSTTTFNVLATTVLSGCSVQMTNTPTVTVNTAPSFTVQPGNQTTCAGTGNAASFSVTVAGSPTPTCQWYEKPGSGSFVAITNGTGSNGTTVYGGATTSTLTVTNPTAGMNGYTYYCIATNTCSTPTSNTVTLTISSVGQWIGTTSIDWNTAANWCGSVPTSTTDVTIPSGTTYQPTISAAVSCRNLTINSGATVTVTTGGNLSLYGNLVVSGTYTHTAGTLTLTGNTPQSIPAISVYDVTVNNSNGVAISGDLTVTGTLNLTTGNITTNSNEINVTNNSTASVSGFSSSSYIIGNLRRTVSGSGSYDYPLGTSTKYEYLNITLSSITGFTNILGKFNNSSPIASIPLLNVFVMGTMISGLLDYGYWTLTPNSTITGGTYSVTVKEQGQSNSAAGAGYYTLLKRHDILSGWQSLGTHLNNTQTVSGGIVTAVRSNLNSFSDYSIGYGGSTLPIKLMSFTAEKTNDDKDALLKWSTASEENNDHFELEVATANNDNGQLNFKKIGEVRGTGTSYTQNDYEFTDTEAGKSGIRYYRLKQVDFDSTSTYSDIEALEFVNNIVQLTQLYPNPVSDLLFFNVQSPDNRTVNISVNNIAGQEVFKEALDLTPGNNSFNFDLRELLNGIYLFNLQGGTDVTLQQKFIKD